MLNFEGVDSISSKIARFWCVQTDAITVLTEQNLKKLSNIY